MKFGKILEKLLLENDISQVELARKLKLSPKTVNEWIGANAREPRSKALKALAEFFDVSVHFLLFGEEDPKSVVMDIFKSGSEHTGIYQISIRKLSVNEKKNTRKVANEK